MQTSKIKKGLSLLLSIIMIFTMMPVTIFTLGADEAALPLMKKFDSASGGDFHAVAYYKNVYSVTFLDYIDYDAMAEEGTVSWNISASAETGVVMAWAEPRADGKYDVYIGGEGGVQAHEDTTFLFYVFSSLTYVNGTENLHTDNVKSLQGWFFGCSALKEVDLSSWNTSNVTSMKDMFRNCHALTKADLSGFDTSKVTSMVGAFYLCKNLDYIYAGEGWTTEAIFNLSEGVFNCCYAKFGVTEDEYLENTNNGAQYDASASKATFDEGGYLTRTYKVTYEYRGEVPENVTELPDVAYYPAADVVGVKSSSSADGYVFSGWATEDADISENNFVMPEKDVLIYGSFKKPVDSVEINGAEKVTLNKGEETNIIVVVKPEEATVKDIIYESSDETVVTVDENGKITAVGDGTATITVVSKDDPTKKDTITVTVKIPVEEVVIETEDTTLNIGENVTVDVTVNPGEVTNKEVTYKSSNEDVVTVDEYGKVTAVGEGTATVIVTSKDDPTKKDTITVTVKVPVEDVVIGNKDITLGVGADITLDVTVKPEGATDKEVIYESSDETVAKVDENGKITAVDEGDAIITVTSKDDPTVKKEILVTVIRYKVTYEFGGESIPAGVAVPVDENRYENGNVVKIKEEPSASGYKFLGWKTSNDVDIKDGKFNIYNDVHLIGVWEIIHVTGIIVENPEINFKEGETDKIIAKVTPDDALNKEVTYKSSDETVVKVDEEGNVTAVGEGDATIIVISKDDPSVTFTIKVTVEKPVVPVEKIEVDKTEITLTPDGTDKLTVKVTPDDATNKEVTFESSDENVVVVDKDGNITAKNEGEATITVKADGKVTTVKVTVEKPVVEEPVKITAPEKITIVLGEEKEIGATINTGETLTYSSSDESIVKVDANGNITAVAAGKATITVSGGGVSAIIAIEVTAKPAYDTKHYMVFGKTEKIGWYSVSLDGGESFLLVFGNSHLEVAHGSEVIIKANDVFGDPFTFYVNGKAVKPDENGYVRVIVDKYVLVGALGIDFPIEIPDAEESLNLIQRIIQAIKNFFAMIASWFKR